MLLLHCYPHGGTHRPSRTGLVDLGTAGSVSARNRGVVEREAARLCSVSGHCLLIVDVEGRITDYFTTIELV